ncbi:hypothetical protein Q8F55_008464 [Vanrija albida]|uniref:DUF1275 domain protein n=1 Tax=Vanrija albida TaxID=181172 RepID=A0ABR3PRY0_9TREE
MDAGSLSTAAESPADEPKAAPPPPPPSFWNAELTFERRTYIPVLLSLSIAAGSIDVFSVPALGVFVANNTGNLVFLALAASQMKKYDPEVYPVAAVVALVGSWFGSFYSGHLGRYFGKRRRGYVVADMTVQAALIFLVAGLYYGRKIHIRDGRTEYASIFLMAVSMGSQNVTVKGLGGPPTMPTQVATGAMSDFFADPNLFVGLTKNPQRNERFVFVCVFVLGGIIGGFAYRYSSPQLALIITGVTKLLATVFLLVLSKPAPPKAAPPKA